jgi:hypothetical protein
VKFNVSDPDSSRARSSQRQSRAETWWVAKVTCRVLDHQMFFAQLSVSVTQGWDTLAWPTKLRSRRFWFYDLARFDCDLNVEALEQLEHAAEYRIGVSSALGF